MRTIAERNAPENRLVTWLLVGCRRWAVADSAERRERIFHFLPRLTLSTTAHVVGYGGSDLLDAGDHQFTGRRQSPRRIEWFLGNWLQNRQLPPDFHIKRRHVS